MRLSLALLLGVIMLLLAACGGTEALHSADDIRQGEALFTLDFSDPTSFETGDFPDENASLRIEDGAYVLQQSGESNRYIWGQGGELAGEVDLRVQATSQAAYTNNLYGVMCRVSPEGEGYAFLVSNDGFGAIARAELGRRLSLTFIVPWTEHDAINGGTATNDLRAVCVGDYLALYVNDTFIGDAEDETFNQAGEVGLIGGFFVEGGDERGEVQVRFDNLSAQAASLGN